MALRWEQGPGEQDSGKQGPGKQGPVRWVLASAVVLAGCGSEVVVFRGDGGSSDPSTSTVSVGGSGGVGGTTSVGGIDGVGPGPSTGGSGAGCQDEVVPTEPVYDPVDVVLVVDNGFSMVDANQALEGSINSSFAQILDNAGIDHRIVVLSDHGTQSHQLCIPPPLSGTANCAGPPVEVPGEFYHYDVDVPFNGALCTILDTAWGAMGGGQPDQNGFHPGGWVPLLRPDAHHALVVYTFSGVGCLHDGTQYFDQNTNAQGQAVAIDWDKALLNLAPGTFGTPADRRYVLHSIIGMPPKTPDPLAPYDPFEPVSTMQCGGTFAPGTGYQWLSKGTLGLRFPSCQYNGASTMLTNLASEVTTTALDRCTLQLPPSTRNPEELTIIYTPDAGTPEEWLQVVSEPACGNTDHTFYIDSGTTPEAHLCPETCQKLKAHAGITEVVRVCVRPHT